MFDFVVTVVEKSGYAGVFALMLAETVFPPFPSELIMPLAGFAAARGDLRFLGVALSGAGGSLAGALFWYFVGCSIGLERLRRWTGNHGRWIALSPDELDRVNGWFRRHCGKAVLFGRLLPTVRTLVSIPAGVTQMGLGRFAVYSAIGSALWAGALAAAGYLLEARYEQVAAYVKPIAAIVLATIFGAYLYRVATFGRRKNRQD